MKSFSLALAAAFATSSLLALAGARADLAGAAFPGANGKIAFQTNRDLNQNWEIYSMNPDGSGQTNLTNNACLDAQPAWSPDGSRIAFVSSRQFCAGGQLDLWVMGASGSSPTKVTDIARSPTWAPDGQRIAYICGQAVCVINADGSGKAVVHEDTALLGRLAWSPDGSTIAFDRTLGALGIEEIAAMNPDGTNVRRLTAQGLRPNWSPDGTTIAYTSLDSSNNRQIFVMGATGDAGGRTQLTFTSGYNIFGERSWNDTPAWSPDGLEIAFATNRDGDIEVYTMKSDGTLQIAVSGAPAVDWNPDWQVGGATAGADHDVGVAGGGFHTDGHVTLSREGPGPFPVKIKVKNFGQVSENIGYEVDSSEPVTLSAGCSGTVANVQPGDSVIVSTCTVSYLESADPDPILTLTVTHGADGGTDSNPANNTKQQAVVINP
jgi:Tol biopolymer transport system component